MLDDDFLHLLRGLVREPSIVGEEDAFFRVLRRELEELPVAVTRYHGLLVVQGNDPDGEILSAHVDRHGLLCTGPNEFQYAAFIAGNTNDLTGDSVSEQMLDMIGDRFVGQRVQAHMPYTGSYLGQGVITKSEKCPFRRTINFEVDGLAFLQPGAPVSFLDRLKVTRHELAAQLDNVLSVAIIVHLFRRGFQGTGLLTAGEEAGRSWRYSLDWFYRQGRTTQRLIVLDTSPFPSRDQLENHDVVLRRRDASATFAPGITEELREACVNSRISTIFKDEYVERLNLTREKPMSLGRTELGRLAVATAGEINGTTLQVPTTGYHTAQETARIASVAAVIELLMGYV